MASESTPTEPAGSAGPAGEPEPDHADSGLQALLVSERLARAALDAAHQQARDGSLLQAVVAQSVALMHSTRTGDVEQRQRLEQLLRDTLGTLTSPARG
jgi:hypothetical protein